MLPLPACPWKQNLCRGAGTRAAQPRWPMDEAGTHRMYGASDAYKGGDACMQGRAMGQATGTDMRRRGAAPMHKIYFPCPCHQNQNGIQSIKAISESTCCSKSTANLGTAQERSTHLIIDPPSRERVACPPKQLNFGMQHPISPALVILSWESSSFSYGS
jgi:hypothetical protein